MSFPSGAIWNCRSGFGICFKHTTMFRGTARGRRRGRYLIVSCDSLGDGRHALAVGSFAEPRTRVSRPALVPPAEGISQDADAPAADRQGPRAAGIDPRSRRILVRHRFWTLSIWEDERALTAFVGRDPHRVTMGILEPYMAETAFTRWTIRGSDVPPSWDEAMQRADATSTK